MSRTVGGGSRGARMKLECVPDSDLKSKIDSLIANSTEVVGKLVSLTWGANYEVSDAENDTTPGGIIVDYEKEKSSYVLVVELWYYVDQNGVGHTPVMIQNLPYSGSIALQDSIIVNSTTYMNVDDGGTGGWGAVIAKDVPSGYVDVIF